MARVRNPNLQILEIAAEKLGPLTSELVFLGGCATALLFTDPAAPPVRVTRDVDVITEVGSLADYHRLGSRLRDQGFQEDQSAGAPICRWVGHGVLVDVMPTDPRILGFTNRWYAKAIETAQDYELESKQIIRLVTPVLFIATKLDAFDGRGKQDYVMSHDMEDVISVLDGRPELVAEIQDSDAELRDCVAHRFALLMDDPQFQDALPGHLPGDAASQARLPELISRIQGITRANRS
jgi:hypothetical protein